MDSDIGDALDAPASPPGAATAIGPSVPETLFAAFNEDLVNKKYVDVTVAYFNQRTETAEVVSECHRLALAVKSRLLARALRGLDHEDDVRIVLTGDIGVEEGYEFVRTIYDPAKSPAEINLWNELEVPLGAGFDDNFCGFCKRDYTYRGDAIGGDFDDDDAEDGLQRLLDDLGDGDSPYIPEKKKPKAVLGRGRRKKRKTTLMLRDRKRQPRVDEARMVEFAQKHDLPEERVQELVLNKAKLLDLRSRGLGTPVWSRFSLIFCEGERIPFVCCNKCKIVKSFLPSKGSAVLSEHVGKCSGKEGDFSGPPDGKENEEQFIGEDKVPSRDYIAQLLATGSERVTICPPEICTTTMPQGLVEMFDLVSYEGNVLPYAVCKRCPRVLLWNERKPGHLRRHVCKDEEVKSGGDGATDASQLTREDLTTLIITKSESVSYRVFPAMPMKADKIKQIYYKNYPTTFSYCKVCYQVIKVDTINVHKCTAALQDLTQIYKNEPSRILVHQDVILNIMFPYIFPISLDGNGIEYALCRQCGTILPRDIVPAGDFKHRCHRILANLSVPTEKFHSDNLRALPKKDTGANSRKFECLLCSEVLATRYRAEKHMRSVHGEGGSEVMCSFCGKGFSTLRRAKQHELLVHDSAKTAQDRDYRCHECNISFIDKGKLKRHMLGKHSVEAPFVCSLCGKVKATLPDIIPREKFQLCFSPSVGSSLFDDTLTRTALGSSNVTFAKR